MSHHPAPHRHRVTFLELAFGVAGGPLAWFIQFNAGYALASWACFPQDHRMSVPLAGYAWTGPAMVGVMVAGVCVALLALWISWRAFVRTREEAPGDHGHLMDVGLGRTRFLMFWGVVLGSGFAVVTALTAIAFVVLPRCAG